MDPRDTRDDLTVEPLAPEEPVRPYWLLDDTTSVSDPDESVTSTTRVEELDTSPAAGEPPRTTSARRAGIIGAVAGAVAAALVSTAIVALDDDGTRAATDRPAPVRATNGSGLDVNAVLTAVQDAVVAINVEQSFGIGLVRGAGTGMVIEPDGLVLTNDHVVERATNISVTLPDGRDVDADLVGSIRSNDIALIQLRGVDDLDTVVFGQSSDARVGDPVVAIGNALGLGGTPSVTTGIVSALARELEAENGVELSELMQTDAAIYPGNSGGPLVNAQGEVIGVNTAIARGPEGVGSENLGFALPIDQLKPLIDELKQGGGEIRGGAFLGVRTTDLDDVQPAIRDRLGIETDRGAFVAEVVPGSAADSAGIDAGDVILEIDGNEVETAADVGDVVTKLAPGDEIEVTVERDGEEETVTVTLGSRGVEQ